MCQLGISWLIFQLIDYRHAHYLRLLLNVRSSKSKGERQEILTIAKAL